MPLTFKALPTDDVRALQAGQPDANRQMPERGVSNGVGTPCRHCLTNIPDGKEMLILAYRPFPVPQPYAETGPIFLCANQCHRHHDTSVLPKMFEAWQNILVRGYTAENRIKYGTGKVIEISAVERVVGQIFEDQDVAYVHMRSASNNCYQCRIERS